jgi:hypothetical protein
MASLQHVSPMHLVKNQCRSNCNKSHIKQVTYNQQQCMSSSSSHQACFAQCGALYRVYVTQLI